MVYEYKFLKCCMNKRDLCLCREDCNCSLKIQRQKWEMVRGDIRREEGHQYAYIIPSPLPISISLEVFFQTGTTSVVP